MKERRLSNRQAFAAMSIFLERYYERGSTSDDLAVLLGDLQITKNDGLPLDPAAWSDWLAAVEQVLEKERQEVLAAPQR
jgi:hypothetical protein